MAEKAIDSFLRLPLRAKAVYLLNRTLASTLGVRAVSKDTYPATAGWISRLLYFERLLDLVRGKQGDIVECGVASGRSLIILARLARERGATARIWGFDSFVGLPSPSSEDSGSPKILVRKGKFGAKTEHVVLANLRLVGLDEDYIENQVVLVKGLFSQTLPEYNGSAIILLHIDAVLHDSYKTALENLWPRVTVGGVVALDEYHQPNFPGVTKAVDEYFRHHPGSVTIRKDTIINRYYGIKLR